MDHVAEQQTVQRRTRRRIRVISVIIVTAVAAAAALVLVRWHLGRESALHDANGNPYSAEQLYFRMESRLAGAPTLQCDFRGEVRGGPGATYHGSLTLARWNRQRLEWADETDGERREGLAVSDGLRAKARGDSPISFPHKGDRTPRRMNEETAELFAAQGTFGLLPPSTELHLADLRPCRFAMGPKEEVGGRLAQVLEYELNVCYTGSDGKLVLPPEGGCPAKVWIDARSGLPLKRVITDGPVEITEVYTRLELGRSVVSGAFEVPQ